MNYILINPRACPSPPTAARQKFHISQGNWNKDEMTWLYLGQIKSDFHKIFRIPFFTLKNFFDKKINLKKLKKFQPPPKKFLFWPKKTKKNEKFLDLPPPNFFFFF